MFEGVQSATDTRASVKNDLKLPKMRLSMKRNEYVSITTKLYNMLNISGRETNLVKNFERTVENMIAMEFSNEKLRTMTSQ